MVDQFASTIDGNALQEFQALRMGWLTHEGKLLPCRLHGHLGRLMSEPLFDEAFRRYKKAIADNEAYIEQELESLDPDEPPEMHRFEGIDDEAKAELVDAIYRAGWIRIGMAYDREKAQFNRRSDGPFNRDPLKDPRNWYMEAEGHDIGLKARDRDLSAIATAIGCTMRRCSLKPLELKLDAGPGGMRLADDGSAGLPCP